MRQATTSRAAGRFLRTLAAAGVVGLLGPGPASAIDFERKWTVGVRVADYLPVDKQGGGFRVSSGVLGTRGEKTVNLEEVPVPSFSIGYGLKEWTGAKRWQNAQLTLELEVARFESGVGNETVYQDDNASSRIHLCTNTGILQDGDEELFTVPVAELTLTPMFLNALFHWGPPRADFYAGVGGGVVLAESKERQEYRDFVGDFDGDDDVTVGDVIAANVKVGSNVRLSQSGRWYLYFEAQFFSTELFGTQDRLAWAGIDNFFGSQDLDCSSPPDGVPDDIGVLADFRLVDPGDIRLDGALAGVGLRYRFGGGRSEAK